MSSLSVILFLFLTFNFIFFCKRNVQFVTTINNIQSPSLSLWTARSTRLYLRHFVSKYFLLLIIYRSFFSPADTAGRPQTVDCSLFRCERPRRILESPLSEISAKTSTTIETERVRRGEVSPRLRQRPGEAGEIIRRNKRELKFSQTFSKFLQCCCAS